MAGIAVLSSTGFLIALYFTLVYHKLMPPDARVLPRFCRMESGACASLLSTADARLLRVPNFYPGLLFYAAMFTFAMSPAWHNPLVKTMIAASGMALLSSLYLSYSLFMKLKIACALCYTSHAINFLLFILLLCL